MESAPAVPRFEPVPCAGAKPPSSAGRARARPRYAYALRHRLRQRRLLDLLRPRPHRGLRAWTDPRSSSSSRASSSPPPRHLRGGDVRFPRRAAPPASPVTRSTSWYRSARAGRRCSSTSSPSPRRRSSSRTTSRSSGGRCANPWDVVGGIVVIVTLVVLNIVGIQEAARLSITLAVIDFATRSCSSRSGSCSSSTPRSSSTTSTSGSRRRGATWRSRCRWRCSPTRGGDRLEPGGRGARPGQERPSCVQARRACRLRDLLHPCR